jgi:2,3,4,5-tetrahydropyridine-2-carboxylate N-succinyltransferase
VFDLVRGHDLSTQPLMRRSKFPAGAVVVPGSRAINSDKAREWGLSLYAPIIVKYRDEKTDAATQLGGGSALSHSFRHHFCAALRRA